MTASNTAAHRPNAGAFKKGDSRINRHGQISGKRLQFGRTLKELLVAEGESMATIESASGTKERIKKVALLVKVVWREALKGEAWAIQFIAERTEGKVTQPIDGDLRNEFVITYEEPGA